MNIEKRNEDALPRLKDARVQEMAESITKKVDMDKAEVAKFIRSFWFKMFLELEEDGKADFLGIGQLEIDKDNPNGGYKLIRYPEDKIRMKQQLKLQQQLGGDLGDIGNLSSEEELNVCMDFNFPIEELIEQLAEYRNIPAERMKKKFGEQLNQAFIELVETGKEGHLPDFGVIRYGDGGLRDVIFDINEEVAELFKKQEE